jgi:methylenetetrahydrofolate reductase (NADPH)
VKIVDILKTRENGVSFEFFPPKTEEGKREFRKVIGDLREYNPLYVSVTYGAGGSTQDRTRDTLLMLKSETDLTLMSHLTSINTTEQEMHSILRDYIKNGIDNILALRGDPPKDTEGFDPTKGEFQYARDLVQFLKQYDGFSIAVAVYPEVHMESPSPEKDLEYTKIKVDAGADFAITQMLFDNSYYYRFLEKAQKKGITIPILPGIMPITDFNRTKQFSSQCKATIPVEIEEKMSHALDKPHEMKKVGVEIAIKQCEDLLDHGVRYLHFYTLNKSEAVTQIIDTLRHRLQ